MWSILQFCRNKINEEKDKEKGWTGYPAKGKDYQPVIRPSVNSIGFQPFSRQGIRPNPEFDIRSDVKNKKNQIKLISTVKIRCKLVA